jgi:competence protein ComEA
VAVVAVLAVLAVGLTLVVLVGSQPQATSVPLPAGEPSPTSDPTPGPVQPGPSPGGEAKPRPTAVPDLVVHVAGAVARPGVVVLPPGSRVVDAVDAAGGPLAGTSLDSVNLARVLVDGEQVRVGLEPDPALTSPGSPAAAGSAPAQGSAPVDLNAATEADLDALPGIGPVLARRIVEWRERNGQFAAVTDLLEVAGIGPAVLDDLQGRVTV